MPFKLYLSLAHCFIRLCVPRGCSFIPALCYYWAGEKSPLPRYRAQILLSLQYSFRSSLFEKEKNIYPSILILVRRLVREDTRKREAEGAWFRAILRVVTRRQVRVSIPFATSRIIVSPRYVYRIYRGCTQRLCTHVSLAQVAAYYEYEPPSSSQRSIFLLLLLLRECSNARAFTHPSTSSR